MISRENTIISLVLFWNLIHIFDSPNSMKGLWNESCDAIINSNFSKFFKAKFFVKFHCSFLNIRCDEINALKSQSVCFLQFEIQAVLNIGTETTFIYYETQFYLTPHPKKQELLFSHFLLKHIHIQILYPNPKSLYLILILNPYPNSFS